MTAYVCVRNRVFMLKKKQECMQCRFNEFTVGRCVKNVEKKETIFIKKLGVTLSAINCFIVVNVLYLKKKIFGL